MQEFAELLNEAMRSKGFSIRSLEDELIKEYGEKNKISRSLIGDYKQGKRAPTYGSALMLADVLQINRSEFLAAAFRLKNDVRKDAERRRFEDFCRRKKIKIDGIKDM